MDFIENHYLWRIKRTISDSFSTRMKKKKDIFTSDISLDSDDDSIGFVMPILSDNEADDDFTQGLDKIGDEVPILALRNLVLFPGVALPVIVARPKSKSLVDDAVRNHAVVGVVSQKDADVEDPGYDDLYHVGVLADIVRVFELPDGSTTAIFQGKKRFKLDSLTSNMPYMKGHIEQIDDVMPKSSDDEFKLLVTGIRDITIRLMQANPSVPKDIVSALKGNKNDRYMVNFSAANFPATSSEKQTLLEDDKLKDRAMNLFGILSRVEHLMKLKDSIQKKTQIEIMKQQKDFFLQQQLKTIREELGDNQEDPQITELRRKAEQKKWSKDVAGVFDKEIEKIGRLHPQSPEYSVQFEYLNTIVSLPWEEYSVDNFSLDRAEKILNRDHYGLDKVKERILEYLSVLKLKGDMKSPILCLYGPPGVGKTSLGHSIAAALGRKYIRMSLGGLHDEAEIRGHRRTYVGAMLGRILRNIQKAGTSNPVFVLDEIDKVTADMHGDPSSALLEVLDPEQNDSFHDNYLDIDYDLSHVMFICTANNINNISQPLLDRMEMIEVPGYITEEKIEIAQRHLVPKQLAANGLPKKGVRFRKTALQGIIESYTRESGVRELDMKIAKIMRRAAKKMASNEALPPFNIGPNDLHEYLGEVEYQREKYQGNEYTGVVVGLAWTAVGGEILYVESSLSKGKGSKLTLTGNLGDVMKESAMLALEYIHSHQADFNIPEEMFENWNVHIHVPEGAIPKDGPSAGVTMVTSLVSSFTGRRVRLNLAMTGEITLRGKVLPVGGIREKLLAARRAGITDIIICSENKRNVDEIKPEYLNGLTFHYVDDIQQVVDYALL